MACFYCCSCCCCFVLIIVIVFLFSGFRIFFAALFFGFRWWPLLFRRTSWSFKLDCHRLLMMFPWSNRPSFYFSVDVFDFYRELVFAFFTSLLLADSDWRRWWYYKVLFLRTSIGKRDKLMSSTETSVLLPRLMVFFSTWSFLFFWRTFLELSRLQLSRICLKVIFSVIVYERFRLLPRETAREFNKPIGKNALLDWCI